MTRKLILLSIIAAFLCSCSGAQIEQIEKQNNLDFVVNDPNASFLDVSARMRFLRSVDHYYVSSARMGTQDCDDAYLPDPVDYHLVIPPFYEDRAGWLKAHAPIMAFEDRITQLAEAYITTGKESYAGCLLKTLNYWAIHNSLYSFDYSGNHKQAWFAVEWAMACAGMSYSVIKPVPSLDPALKTTVEAWLKRVAKKQTSYPGGPTSSRNNHSHWRGLEAAIVGVITDDDELFRYGIQRYLLAMSAMSNGGSWPLEMRRGNRAMHYQNYAILPLVYIAEIASRQGYDLYSLKVDGKDLHLAVDFFLEFMQGKKVSSAVYRRQDQSFIYKRRELNWMEPYNNRFPNERIRKILGYSRPIAHNWSGGSSTIYFFDFIEPAPTPQTDVKTFLKSLHEPE